MYAPYRQAFRRLGIRISAKTIHASKGLEARAVFIIGLTEGYGGFPDVWMEDRIFQVIKASQHDLLLEEERRLFYVAMTRAKDELYLITEKGNESSFLQEIPPSFTLSRNQPLTAVGERVRLCPNCDQQLENTFSFCPYCGQEV